MSTNAMHVARTGLDAQQTRLQVITNNLANVNTTGFKRDRASFETLLYQTHRPAGAQTSDQTALTGPMAVGTGVRVVATEKIHTQGAMNMTGNALDMAIDGRGFFSGSYAGWARGVYPRWRLFAQCRWHVDHR